MAAATTIALGVAAGASVFAAYESEKARVEQVKASKKGRRSARSAQAEQTELAQKEEIAANKKLKEQQARLLKGTQGRSGLLFGTEKGTEQPLKQTLGA